MQGTTYRVESISDNELSKTVKMWADQLGAIGPLNFQFFLTPDGPVCFEINPRFSGTTGCRYHFGYNDVKLSIQHFHLGEKIVQPSILPGVVLRFWDELYLPNSSFKSLQTALEMN